MRHAAQHTAPADSSAILAFAVITVITLLGFGIYKMRINRRVRSKALEVKQSCSEAQSSHCSRVCLIASFFCSGIWRCKFLQKNDGRFHLSCVSPLSCLQHSAKTTTAALILFCKFAFQSLGSFG